MLLYGCRDVQVDLAGPPSCGNTLPRKLLACEEVSRWMQKHGKWLPFRIASPSQLPEALHDIAVYS